MISSIGLGFIALAWVVQLLMQNPQEIKTWFFVSYLVGLLFLIVDGFMSTTAQSSIINCIIFVIISATFYSVSKTKV